METIGKNVIEQYYTVKEMLYNSAVTTGCKGCMIIFINERVEPENVMLLARDGYDINITTYLQSKNDGSVFDKLLVTWKNAEEGKEGIITYGNEINGEKINRLPDSVITNFFNPQNDVSSQIKDIESLQAFEIREESAKVQYNVLAKEFEQQREKLKIDKVYVSPATVFPEVVNLLENDGYNVELKK